MPFRCSVRIVRSRAMSRRFSRIRTGFWSCRMEFRNLRLKSSSCSSWIFCSISASTRSRIFSAFSSRMLAPRDVVPRDELRPDRKLAGAEVHRLPRLLHADPLQLEEDPPGLHDGHPVLGGPLPAAHPGLGGFHGHRLVREDPDPHLAVALDEARDRDARRLDLPVGDPRRLERLQRELAERDRGAAMGHALGAAPHLLAVLDTLRHQHRRSPYALRTWLGAAAGAASRLSRTSPLKIHTFTPQVP